MQITEAMVNDLNDVLDKKNLIIRFKYYNDDQTMKVCLVDERFLDSYIINITEDFYDFIRKFLLSYGVELKRNNTGSTFWGKYSD